MDVVVRNQRLSHLVFWILVHVFFQVLATQTPTHMFNIFGNLNDFDTEHCKFPTVADACVESAKPPTHNPMSRDNGFRSQSQRVRKSPCEASSFSDFPEILEQRELLLDAWANLVSPTFVPHPGLQVGNGKTTRGRSPTRRSTVASRYWESCANNRAEWGEPRRLRNIEEQQRLAKLAE